MIFLKRSKIFFFFKFMTKEKLSRKAFVLVFDLLEEPNNYLVFNNSYYWFKMIFPYWFWSFIIIFFSISLHGVLKFYTIYLYCCIKCLHNTIQSLFHHNRYYIIRKYATTYTKPNLLYYIAAGGCLIYLKWKLFPPNRKVHFSWI